MSANHLSRFALAAFALATGLSAQNSIVRGELADGRATGCYYCPGFAHVIKFSGTRLQSPTINLNQFFNQMVELTGSWDGTIFTVAAAQVVPESFSITGNTAIGRRVRWNAVGTPGDLAIQAIAFDTSFVVPVGTMAMLLGPTASLLGVGVLDSNGELKTDLDIPQNPALVGVRMNGQAFFVPQNAGPFWSSNLGSAVVQP